MNAGQLSTKITSVLKRVNATDRAVYKRQVVISGGDAFLGISGTVQRTDTLFVPQPALQIVGPSELLISGSSVLPLGTVIALVTPQMMSRQELESKNIWIVMKGADNIEEEFDIETYTPSFIGGADVAFSLTLRSKARQ